jgi:tRNA modification GTPase
MTVQRGPSDTIIALASGSGRAGVAVIRISGSGSAALLKGMTRLPAAGTGGADVSRETSLTSIDLPQAFPKPRRAVIRTLHDAEGGFIDEALVLWMPAPHSYTGEDVVEFHVHGGPAVVEAVIGAALKTRLCRIAEPGEFTRRAFDAGRIDLTQKASAARPAASTRAKPPASSKAGAACWSPPWPRWRPRSTFRTRPIFPEK